MKEIKVGKHTLQIFESIEDLPVVRHHKFSKLMLIDAHIGSTLTDFDGHMERVIRYLRANKNDLAEKELMNMRQNFYMIQEEVSPRYMAFSALVKSIDGEVNDDLSDEALKKVITKLSDVSVSELDRVIEEGKKKLDTELQIYYPELFDSSLVKEYFDRLKKRTLLLLKKLENEALEESEKKELADLTDSLILYSDPQVFSGSESIEIQQDRQFENACLAIAQTTYTDPKKFTVLEYYNALFYMKEQNKKQKKKTHRK